MRDVTNLHPLDNILQARCIFYRKGTNKIIFILNDVTTFLNMLTKSSYTKLVVFHIQRFEKMGIEVQIEDLKLPASWPVSFPALPVKYLNTH